MKWIKIQFERLQFWYYWWERFMKYVVEVASDSMVYIPSFMKIGSVNQLILSLLPRQWEAAVLVLLMGRIYDVCRWDVFRWHDIYTPSFMTIGSGIRVILRVLPQLFEGLVLVLLIRGISYIRHWNDLRWHDIHTKSHDHRFRFSGNIRDITSKIWEVMVLILLMRGIYDIRHWDGLRWHDIWIQNVIKIGTDVQAISKFCLRNLRGRNVGITDGRD
jgi:hypothetical protein